MLASPFASSSAFPWVTLPKNYTSTASLLFSVSQHLRTACLFSTSIPAITALSIHVQNLRLRVRALYKWSEIERLRRFTSVNNGLCFLGLHCLHRLLGSCGCCLCCLLGHLVEHGKGVNLRECECHSRLASLNIKNWETYTILTRFYLRPQGGAPPPRPPAN